MRFADDMAIIAKRLEELQDMVNRLVNKYLGSVLTSDSYCTKKIKARIVMAKETYNRKLSVLTSKLNINSGRNWSDIFEALDSMAQRPGQQEYWSGSIWRILKCGVGGK